MKLNFVTVHTADLDTSIDFYGRVLGLPLLRRFSPRPGMEIAFVGDGEGGQIEFIADPEAGAFAGAGISLGFRVDDVGDTARMLAARQVELLFGPIAMPNGVRLLRARDPNGLELVFVEE